MATDLVTKADSAPSIIKNYAIMEFEPEGIHEIIGDNLGNGGISPSDLLRTKVPSGESSAMWSIPSPDGEDEAVKTLDGVIVYWQDVRAYWKESFSGGGTPPDCSSNDCLAGTGDIGEGIGTRECAACPMAQFGSAVKQNGEAGNGQACRQMRLLFVLRETDLLPIVVACPPTSLKPMRQYFLQLASRRSPYHGVVTSLSLEKTKSGDGISFYLVKPKMIGRLSDDEHARVKPLAAMLKPAVDVQAMAESEAPPY